MIDPIDAPYYAQRERQSRDRAASADQPGVRRIHLELAERYRQLRREAMNVVRAV